MGHQLVAFVLVTAWRNAAPLLTPPLGPPGSGGFEELGLKADGEERSWWGGAGQGQVIYDPLSFLF